MSQTRLLFRWLVLSPFSKVGCLVFDLWHPSCALSWRYVTISQSLSLSLSLSLSHPFAIYNRLLHLESLQCTFLDSFSLTIAQHIRGYCFVGRGEKTSQTCTNKN